MVRSLASSGRCQPSSTTDTVPRGLRITSTKLALFDYERHFFNVQRFSTSDVEIKPRLHTTRCLLCIVRPTPKRSFIRSMTTCSATSFGSFFDPDRAALPLQVTVTGQGDVGGAALVCFTPTSTTSDKSTSADYDSSLMTRSSSRR